MNQQEKGIWADLIERVALNSQFNKQFYLYSLSQSNVIIHAQISNEDLFNLTLQGTAIVSESDQINFDQFNDEYVVLIQVNSQRIVKNVLCYEKKSPVPLNIKRTSDINDIFKQYVCFYTNFQLPPIPYPDNFSQFHIIIQIQNQANLLFYFDDNQITQVVEELDFSKKQQNKKKPQKQQKDIEDNFSKLQTFMRQNRTTYKDQLDAIGKVSFVKHPQLIRVSYSVPFGNQLDSLAIYYGQIQQEVFEYVTYHKYETDSSICLNEHIKHLKCRIQTLYYTDQAAIPLKSSNDFTQNNLLFPLKLNNRIRLLAQREKLESSEQKLEDKLMNVHSYLLPSKAQDNLKRYTIRGDYVFHHYLQNGVNDSGWGCAYRSFMSVYSWLILNGYTKNQSIPSHKEIQQILAKIDDKGPEFVGSSEWIGAFEVSMLLNHLTGVECKILHVSKGPDVGEKFDEFRQHFITQGSPIMFGGGVYAYSLLGVEQTPEGICRYLILDPHYTNSDNIKTVIEKGGIQWKNQDIFLHNTFYNFCMPQNNQL